MAIVKFLRHLLKRARMAFLLRFKYKITSYGFNFYTGRNNLIKCGNMHVGNNVYIGNNCHLSINDLKIDDYTMLASQVSVVGGDHRFNVVGTPIRDTGRAERRGVTIGKDCWLGHGVIILDGVEIGEGSIIAAGAIVTAPVEPYSIYAGLPAKKIRNRFENDDDVKKHSQAIKGIYYQPNETTDTIV